MTKDCCTCKFCKYITFEHAPDACLALATKDKTTGEITNVKSCYKMSKDVCGKARKLYQPTLMEKIIGFIFMWN